MVTQDHVKGLLSRQSHLLTAQYSRLRVLVPIPRQLELPEETRASCSVSPYPSQPGASEGAEGQQCGEITHPSPVGRAPDHTVWESRTPQPTLTMLSANPSSLCINVRFPPGDHPLPWSKKIHFSQRLINLEISLLTGVTPVRILMHFLKRKSGRILTTEQCYCKMQGQRGHTEDGAGAPSPHLWMAKHSESGQSSRCR